MRHRPVVSQVIAEQPGLTTVVVTGRRLEALPVRGGQFFQWRFRGVPGWTRPTRTHCRRPRTAGHRGSPSSTSATAPGGGRPAPGRRSSSRVRTGGCTSASGSAARCSSASGIGVTPLEAILEDLDQRPGDVVLVHRVHDAAPGCSRQRSTTVRRARRPGRRRAGPAGPGAGVLAARERRAPRRCRGIAAPHSPDVAERDVFVCGASGWMDAVVGAARSAGVPAANIHIETFAL